MIREMEYFDRIICEVPQNQRKVMLNKTDRYEILKINTRSGC